MGQAPLILIVDDSSDDILLLKRAFAKAGVANPMTCLSSGRQAIRYLNGEGEYADREKHPLPSVILLDLQMADGDGFEVLQWIRNKFRSGHLLVVVLTRVEDIKLINRAYSMGANSFLTKPSTAGELQELISIFRGYWLLQNQFPESETDSDKPMYTGIWK